MSQKQHTLIIAPSALRTSENFVFSDFECVKCNGRGGFDTSLYSHGSTLRNDWTICEWCSGKGKLTAKVTVEWTGE